MKHLLPPKWCANAIATNQGWKHPKTGELLISFRGLKDLLNAAKSEISLQTNQIELNEFKNSTDSNITIEIDISNEFIEPIVESVKKQRGRPKRM